MATVNNVIPAADKVAGNSYNRIRPTGAVELSAERKQRFDFRSGEETFDRTQFFRSSSDESYLFGNNEHSDAIGLVCDAIHTTTTRTLSKRTLVAGRAMCRSKRDRLNVGKYQQKKKP